MYRREFVVYKKHKRLGNFDVFVDGSSRVLIFSLAFSCDCQRLFAANADGTVAMWEKASNNRPRDVMFIPFL